MSHIVIVGASVRAAAQSARRAGWQPLSVDRFADTDLHSLGPVQRAGNDPLDLARAARRYPAGPWMYTGAVENHLAVIQAISSERQLLGNEPHVVRAIRDPWQLAQSFAAHGIPFPEARRSQDALDEGDWVSKPFRSGGGFNIRRVRVDQHAGSPHAPRACYWQRFVDGEPLAAIFVGANRRATLLGVTRQLTGCAWARATEFMYVGSVGPLLLPPEQRCQVERMGSCLAETFNLTGLFGVDALCAEGSIWPVEVNPRYTASVEILERAGPLRSISCHVNACLRGELTETWTAIQPTNGPLHGKAILYADRPTTVPPEFADWVDSENQASPWPMIADIPAIGSHISVQHPICTVFAKDESLSAVVARLTERAVVARALLVLGQR